MASPIVGQSDCHGGLYPEGERQQQERERRIFFWVETRTLFPAVNIANVFIADDDEHDDGDDGDDGICFGVVKSHIYILVLLCCHSKTMIIIAMNW